MVKINYKKINLKNETWIHTYISGSFDAENNFTTSSTSISLSFNLFSLFSVKWRLKKEKLYNKEINRKF